MGQPNRAPAKWWGTLRPGLRRAGLVGMWGVAVATLVMWPLSGRLSSVGFEVEQRYGDAVFSQWYGIVYPGNGGVMIGGEARREPYRGQPVDAFDPAGAFLDPPLRDLASTAWERRGFVWRMAGHQRWAGVPAWLAAAVAWVGPVAWTVRRRRRRGA